jgi:hypothetical protein
MLQKNADTHKGKRIRLFFQDEPRVGQKGRVCHIWLPKGERSPGLADKRFAFAYVSAAGPGTDKPSHWCCRSCGRR